MKLAWPPSWPMYVPVDATTAAWAAIALAASRPWRLVELGLVDLPDAARTGQEGVQVEPPRREAARAGGVTTLKGIAAALQARGVRTPRGNVAWAPAPVARLLA